MQSLMDQRRMRKAAGSVPSNQDILDHQKMITSTKIDFLQEKAHEKKTL